MRTRSRRLVTKIAAAAIASVSLAGVAAAQPGPGWGPHMMGPGMWGPSMGMRMCSPSAIGFAEWRVDRLQSILALTEAQRPKFDELKAASAKAIEAMRAACQTAIPNTAVERLAAMEKRLDAMLAAVKTMRPAMEAFYATLSDEQKARLDRDTGPQRRYWRWRDRMW